MCIVAFPHACTACGLADSELAPFANQLCRWQRTSSVGALSGGALRAACARRTVYIRAQSLIS